MKNIIMTLAASIVLLSACEKEDNNIPTINPEQILIGNYWVLTEITNKQGTYDPYENVSPENVTITTDGCPFNVVIDFLETKEYKAYDGNADCFWGPEEYATWEIKEEEESGTVLKFRKTFSNGYFMMSWGYKIEKINDLEMILSVGAIGLHTGDIYVKIYRFKTL